MSETSRECNKQIYTQNYGPSWIYLRDYTGMHGQHNKINL